MIYEIHTFGNGEILKGVFDSIAICLNGSTGTLFEPLKRLGLILGVFWACIYAIYGDQMKVFTNWIIPMAIIMNLLFVPTTSLWIHDPINHYHQKVDNVPYGLAAFSGYVSKLGFVITEQIEKVFSLPDDLKYQKSGSLFAGNIIQQAKTFRITHEDLAENMRSFVGQCVIYTAMMGSKYTIEDLKHSDDLWGLISTHASPVRSFMWRDLRANDQPKNRSQIISCKDGVAKFNAHWGTELDKASTIYGKKIFGKNALIPAKIEFMKYLPLSYSVLGDMSKSATDILKQHMMMYALIDGVETQSTALGNAPNFAVRRAHLQQRSTYETLGSMAGDMLPTMKAVLEAIAYACFLFVIPMSLLPFGYRFLLAWAQILLWLQMWAPLYAILNFIMTMASKAKTTSILSMSNELGVTIASSVGIVNLNADMAAMAGYLSMSIPFLCIALVKGVGSFVHMASHLGNVSQSAAGSAASEITSGNFSYGNINEDNMQISNASMLNHSRSASYKAGSFAMQDGRSEITTMADGSHVVNIGTSNLPTSLYNVDTESAQKSHMATQSYQKGMNLSESSSRHMGTSMRSLMSLSDSISQGESSNHSSQYGITTDQSKALNRTSQLTRDFANTHNIDESKAAHILASASFGTGKVLGLGGSLGTGAQIDAKDQEIYSEAEKFSQDNNFQEGLRESIQAARSIAHNATDDHTKKLARNITGSYEQGMQQRTEAQKSFSESESYNQQASYLQSNAATINQNMNQRFIDWMADQPADNAHGNMGHREAVGILTHDPERAHMYMEQFLQSQGVTPSMPHTSSSTHSDSGTGYRPGDDDGKNISSQGFDSFSSNSWNEDIQEITADNEGFYQEKTYSSYEGFDSSTGHASINQKRNEDNQEPGWFYEGVDDAAIHRVHHAQEEHQTSIHSGREVIEKEGQKIQNRMQEQSGKGVARRVGEKVFNEAKDMIPGLGSEPQQR